jgi:hypothetical protein
MVQLLDLPRELRDAIYTELLLSCRPRPQPKDTVSDVGWCRIQEPESPFLFGCLFASQSRPPTCASLLACNRQVNEEMMQMIRRVKRKGLHAARMDCLEVGGMYHFTWLSAPLVITKKNELPRKEQEDMNLSFSRLVSSWTSYLLGTVTDRVAGMTGRGIVSQAYSTTIEQLWMDIRVLEPNVTAELNPYNRTSWEVCAALKHIFEHGPDPIYKNRKTAAIDEVVLNVLPQGSAHNTSLVYRTTSLSLILEPEDSQNWTNVIRDQLVNVWNKIWAANDFNTADYQARYYRMLLERINRVRICVDGKTFKTRELAIELERGRAEMRRIARR